MPSASQWNLLYCQRVFTSSYLCWLRYFGSKLRSVKPTLHWKRIASSYRFPPDGANSISKQATTQTKRYSPKANSFHIPYYIQAYNRPKHTHRPSCGTHESKCQSLFVLEVPVHILARSLALTVQSTASKLKWNSLHTDNGRIAFVSGIFAFCMCVFEFHSLLFIYFLRHRNHIHKFIVTGTVFVVFTRE